MREMWGTLLDAVARWRKRAFWRHVITSSGSALETDGDVVDEEGLADAIVTIEET